MLDFLAIIFIKYGRFLLFCVFLVWSQMVFSEESSDDKKKEEKIECDDDLKKRIQRQIAFKMSVVSPPASQIINQILELIPGVQTKLPSLKIDYPVLDFLSHSIERWPMAWFRTTVECHYDITGVTVGATYQRTPKVPFAGTAIWVMYFLNHTINKLLKDKAKGALSTSLDTDFFGINVRFEWYKKLKEAIDEKFKKLKELKDKIPSGVPDFATSFIDNFVNKIEEYMTKLQSIVGGVESYLGSGATKLIYMVPEFMQVIPIKSSIFVSWQGGNIKGLEDNSSWVGTNWGFSQYHGGESEWEYWLKQFVVYPTNWDDTSHNYLEEPK